jgi:DNA-binding response OmpR family regulator
MSKMRNIWSSWARRGRTDSATAQRPLRQSDTDGRVGTTLSDLTGHPLKVLIVDQDEHRVAWFARALRDGGHDSEHLHGPDGLKHDLLTHFDVIVLADKLAHADGTDADGFALCRGLRRRGLVTPVLFLMAQANVQERVMALDAGADDVMSWPVEVNEFLARLRALSRRRR